MTGSNFDTDNAIIACYPRGAGGKFLLNCLGMSDRFLLADFNLAISQINGKFSPEQKYNFLISKLDAIQDHWTDCDLGCVQLVQRASTQYHTPHPFHPEIDRLLDSGLFLPLVCHDIDNLEQMLKTWRTSRIIWFVDSDIFINSRRSDYYPNLSLPSYWRKIRGANWPYLAPTTLDEFEQLPDSIKKECEDFFGGEIIEKIKKHVAYNDKKTALSSSRLCYQWRCDWFLDKNYFLDAITQMYADIELGPVPTSFIQDLYDHWVNAITRCPR